MDDFEQFKEERERVDPTASKLSESQWKEAYAAYRSTRKRAGGTRSKNSGRSSRSGRSGELEDSGEKSKRRRGSSKGSSRSSVAFNLVTPESIRRQVRRKSGYKDLRMALDLLSWIAIGIIVLGTAAKLVYFTDAAVALSSIAEAAFDVIVVVLFRLVAHALIDLPDLELHRRMMRAERRTDSPEMDD